MNKASLLLTLALAAGMGCAKGNLPLNRDRSAAPVEKPSAECKAADTGVHQILFGSRDFRSTNWVVLEDRTCVVKINLSGHGNLMNLMRKLKERTGFYTYMLVNKTPVSLWWDEPAFQFPLVKGEDGKVISNLPTDEECEAGAEYLASTFGRAYFEVKSSGTRGPDYLRCYIRGTFSDESSLESFVAWNNPRSLKGELLHLNFARKNGSTATVWIRAVTALH